MNCTFRRVLCALPLLAGFLPGFAAAKPIAFAHGTTVMVEYGAGTMEEAQAFHAPRYDLSAGVGYLALDSQGGELSRDILYGRINYLFKRWNLENAQGNVFGWGGVGRAGTGTDEEDLFTWNAGAQVDYETRRVYASLKTDFFETSVFSHRIDTLQLGIAPYKHDYSSLATWIVVQGRRYTGGIRSGTEWALMLRLFKRGAWIEAGPTLDGKLQAMLMVNF
jgi:hypothetical protein